MVNDAPPKAPSGFMDKLMEGKMPKHKPDLPLVAAAELGNVEEVLRLIDKEKHPVDQQGPHGGNALHYAVVAVKIGVVKILIERGCNVDLQDDSGRSALHHAKNPEMLRLLIESGANKELRDKYGDTPLLSAMKPGNTGDTVTALLKAGCSLEARNAAGHSVIEVARETGDLSSIIAINDYVLSNPDKVSPELKIAVASVTAEAIAKAKPSSITMHYAARITEGTIADSTSRAARNAIAASSAREEDAADASARFDAASNMADAATRISESAQAVVRAVEQASVADSVIITPLAASARKEAARARAEATEARGAVNFFRMMKANPKAKLINEANKAEADRLDSIAQTYEKIAAYTEAEAAVYTAASEGRRPTRDEAKRAADAADREKGTARAAEAEAANAKDVMDAATKAMADAKTAKDEAVRAEAEARPRMAKAADDAIAAAKRAEDARLKPPTPHAPPTPPAPPVDPVLAAEAEAAKSPPPDAPPPPPPAPTVAGPDVPPAPAQEDLYYEDLKRLAEIVTSREDKYKNISEGARKSSFAEMLTDSRGVLPPEKFDALCNRLYEKFSAVRNVIQVVANPTDEVRAAAEARAARAAEEAAKAAREAAERAAKVADAMAATATITKFQGDDLDKRMDKANLDKYLDAKKKYPNITDNPINGQKAHKTAVVTKDAYELCERIAKKAENPSSQAFKDYTNQLKNKIKEIFANECADKKTQTLVGKHLGSILREEMRNAGIKVDRSLGEWFSDVMRSSAGKAQARIALQGLKGGRLDVKNFIDNISSAAPRAQAGAVNAGGGSVER